MIEILAVIIMLLAMMQADEERYHVAMIFAIATLAHLLVVGFLDSGHVYYISAAVFDVLIMMLISRIPKIVGLTITIYRICIAEILVNAAGWAMWVSYMDPYWYNVAFMVLHLWAILALMQKDEIDDVGGYRVDNRLDYLRLIVSARHSNIQGRGKAK